jgi:hypothetical protein
MMLLVRLNVRASFGELFAPPFEHQSQPKKHFKTPQITPTTKRRKVPTTASASSRKNSTGAVIRSAIPQQNMMNAIRHPTIVSSF